jgi:hypothetical protein
MTALRFVMEAVVLLATPGSSSTRISLRLPCADTAVFPTYVPAIECA